MSVKGMMEKICECVTNNLHSGLTPRTTVMIISVIGLAASLADFFTCGDIFHLGSNVCNECKCSVVRESNQCIKTFLLRVYQVANVVLFVGCVVECSCMLQLYIWYTLSFIVFGFIVTIVEFLHNLHREPYWTFIAFVADIMYLFVIFWCLPLIDSYRKSMTPCPGMKITTSHNQVV